jgi:hypothetical protein
MFLGSHQGPSQLLVESHPERSESISEQRVAPTWRLADPLFIDNLAPIHAALPFEEMQGSGETHLALCCGAAPTGRVVLASKAAAREVLAEGGALPGLALVTSFKEWGARHHAFLVLSFQSPRECTQLMAMQVPETAPTLII